MQDSKIQSSKSELDASVQEETLPDVDLPNADTLLLTKYEKYQLEQLNRDFDAYMEMKPNEIHATSTEKFLPIFDKTGLTQSAFNRLIEIANTVEPLSIINNRNKSNDEVNSEVYAELDRKLNRLTYQLFYRERDRNNLTDQVLKWYSLLGAEKPFAEIENYKVRAAVLLINSLKFDHNSAFYEIEYGADPIEAVTYDKRQLAAELLLDAGYASALEEGNSENLELYMQSARSLLSKACFENGVPSFETPTQRSAAALLQETVSAELFFREHNILDANERKINQLKRLCEPRANLLYRAFEAANKLAHNDRNAVGERNEYATRILLSGAADASATPSFVRAGFEREDRPYDKASQTRNGKISADVIMYVFDKEDVKNKPDKVPFQIKGHYNPSRKGSYKISIISLSIFHEFIPTMQTFVGVLKGERVGKPEAVKNNFLHFFKMFLKDNKYIRSEDQAVLDRL
jgi:hypothetical protein